MTGVYVTESEIADALEKLTVRIGDGTAMYAGEDSIAGTVTDRPKAAASLLALVGEKRRETAPKAVVVATPTIGTGLVLHWYRDADVARYNDAALVSASRRGVMLNGESYLHDIPPAWITDAERACGLLKAGRHDEARELATHERDLAFRGEIVEVTR